MYGIEDKMGTLSIQGQTLYLHPDKAVFWKERSRLILADLHLGKAGHFRKAGIAVPQAVASQTLNKLDSLLKRFCPEDVWVLGDLFHSKQNKEWNLWTEFVEMHSDLRFVLIPGNHDRYVFPNESLAYEVWDREYVDPPFIFSHASVETNNSSFINMLGHIHPAIVLKGKGRQSLRLPCFWISEKAIVLPAFGAFTGMHSIEPKHNDKIFAIADDCVWKVYG